jgi:hypothetical protein
MTNTFLVNHAGNLIEAKIGQEFTVFRCGSGHTTFGERAKLIRNTKAHLVFETESGAIVKTVIDNLHQVIGKAAKEGYCVTPKKYEDFKQMIHQATRFWNDKKLMFEYK